MCLQKGKRITKVSKFEGSRSGWVFKTGERGLGYYRDKGSMLGTLSLSRAVWPLQSLPAAPLCLETLVDTSNPVVSGEVP